jgi:hypothetical protein
MKEDRIDTDIKDFKKAIDIVVHYITMEEECNALIIKMSESKK